MSERDGLITTAELAGILDQPDLRLFDCTTYLEPAPEGSSLPYIAVPGRHTFEAGHIPGADFLDLQGEFSDPDTELRFMMPDIAQLEAAFGRHGVGARQPRRAVLHRHADVGDAVLVDAADRSASTMSRCSTAASTNGRPKAARSRPGRRRDIRRRRSRRNRRPDFSSTSTRCSRASADRSTVVVNALGPQFHKGLEPSRYGRPGRIPGSCNVSAATLLDPPTKAFVPLADAEAKFAAQGLRKDKRVVAYCGGGISATIDLFLLHRLGYDNLTLYDGSMGEWAKDDVAADRDGLAASLRVIASERSNPASANAAEAGSLRRYRSAQ